MTANDIRNIALLGHGGSGKTSLAEQMLFMTKGTDRLGKSADGNTVCDYDAEEIKRQISISLAFAPVNYNKVKINVMDAPGNFDFAGEAVCAIRAAECAVIVGAAKDGLSVGMERSWKMLGSKPRMIFINRTEEDNSDYQSCLDAIKEKFGTAIAPIVAPVIDGNKVVTAIVDLLHNKAYEVKGGKAVECPIPADMADEVEALRAELMEAAAGADEELMEKFFEEMELSAEDMAKGLKIGVREGTVCPVMCGSAVTGLGVEMLMQTIIDLVPVATDMPAEEAEDDDGNAIEVAYDPNGTTAALVFKTISDQYGKYSMIKVIRGKVTGDMSLYNMTTGNTEKMGRLYYMKGKKTEETKEICCGDIAAIGKMDKVKTGDTLCENKTYVKFAPMAFAPACYERAISPKTKQEIEKLGTGLNKLNEEDPTFSVTNNAETHQTVISGAGDIQIDVLCAKLKSRFGVDSELDTPRVAYREKIRSTVRKQGRYKKQTGGSGQFGDVHIIFEPQSEQEEMIFEENVFGGSVPKNYFPAVEKGLRESCLHGVLAGYPVVYLKATLVDGSYHPVDSSEIAFKLAANLAFKAALPEAKPVLMEPIGELKVTIPDSYLGDVMGDLNKRRGRVMGMNPTGDGEQVLEAEVPMAEMMSYAIDLRSMTQSRGTFTFNFVRYEDCPGAAQEKAIAEAKALAEAE
ncbi:MAG: elongation factor G [Clostridiales bacterium]|nr:elongation factor G [Candidatus Cacconaster stercorequi]